ncbi:MAG: DNA gyrase inhibitor YacG [Alphaproteobacteria bacterium]|jgi:endogenous inhibitor of DNA gyrase (YacG/DUF329 family)
MACPICAKNSDAKYRPFCSRRCADIDLGRWLNESYRVPASPHDEDDRTTGDADRTERRQ